MMNRKRLLLVSGAVVVALGITGCGEKPEVRVYEPGQYQGKADTQPWNNGQFKGNKSAWEDAIKTRTQGQNEYVRIGH